MTEIDRDKCIRGLEISIISDTDAGFSTIEIPVQQAENILALLKEQEHERLKVKTRHRNNDGYCPSCGKCIVMDFCPNNCGFCGQAVKWE